MAKSAEGGGSVGVWEVGWTLTIQRPSLWRSLLKNCLAVFSRKTGAKSRKSWCLHCCGEASKENPTAQPSLIRRYAAGNDFLQGSGSAHKLKCLRDSCISNMVWGSGSSCGKVGLDLSDGAPTSCIYLEVVPLLVSKKGCYVPEASLDCGKLVPLPDSSCHVGSQAQCCQSLPFF